MSKWQKKDIDLTSAVYGRVPPQNTELEEAVLGAILLEPECQDIVFDIIATGEIFYKHVHQIIYNNIRQLYDSGAAIDLLTVTEQHRKNGQLEEIGDAYALTKLTQSVLSSAHVDAHARILVEKYMSREMIRISANALSESYDDSADIFDIIDNAANGITNLSTDIVRNEPEPLSKGALDTLKKIKEQAKSQLSYTGIPTGFAELDEKTSGLQKTEVIILAARPSVGKTSLAINILLNAAKAGYPGALFSLEMGKEQIKTRMLSALSGVEISQVSNPNKLTEFEMQRVEAAAHELSKLPIFIDDTAGLNHIQLRAKARKLKKRHNLQLIVLDYLQLMENAERGLSREQQVSQNSRRLKMMAKDMDLPFLALSQLNRGIENDKNRAPNLADLRESGAIEQDADIVMFLSNPSPTLTSQMPIFSGKILLNIAKGRSIGLGNIPLEFNKELQLWKDVDRKTTNVQQKSFEQLTYEEKVANQRLNDRGRELQNNTIEFPPALKDDLPF